MSRAGGDAGPGEGGQSGGMTTDLHGPLSGYAERLHATIGDRHHVASPLGAWLLLALCATAATSLDRDAPTVAEELAEALGTDLASAVEVTRALLDAPHPLVAAATALWHRPGQGDGGPAGWRAALPASTEVGVLPDHAGLDAWAREHTYGLIERFPCRSARTWCSPWPAHRPPGFPGPTRSRSPTPAPSAPTAPGRVACAGCCAARATATGAPS
ncbi:hypothetical protein GCM10027614_17590 [Micromonospora vulcania]